MLKNFFLAVKLCNTTIKYFVVNYSVEMTLKSLN